MNSVFENRNPQPVTETIATRNYDRKTKRNGRFVVEVDKEYVRMITHKPIKFDTCLEPEYASSFSYKNAERVCDYFMNPTIVLVVMDKKTGKYRIVK